MSIKGMNIRKKRKIGLPPGSLVYTGDFKQTINNFYLHVYDKENCSVYRNTEISPILEKIDPQKKCWLSVIGLSQEENIQKIGNFFNISPLLSEDILDTSQRPKCEITEEYLFFTLKMLHNDESEEKISYQQVSMILSKNLMITFQEEDEGCFNSLTTKLEKKGNILRTKDIDYLFYRFIDIAVDYYYLALDKFDTKIEDLELSVNERMEDEDLHHIQHLKRDLISLRRNVYPLREAISILKKEETFFSRDTLLHLSDVYDHIIHVLESIESYRDLSSGLMDMYMTNNSNRMNEIMKVLTIISTIFIPLTFIAGVYGMNFKYIPELRWHWSYPVVILVMVLIAFGMVMYFKRKKWL